MSKKKNDEELVSDLAAKAISSFEDAFIETPTDEPSENSGEEIETLESLSPSAEDLAAETIAIATSTQTATETVSDEFIGQGDLLKEEVALELVNDDENLPKELNDTEAKSAIESLFFASQNPVSMNQLRAIFKGTNLDNEKLKHLVVSLQTDYAGGDRGICLDEVAGGFQLRTKLDNTGWVRKLVKGRAFRLSGPALEVLSIVAYKQPVVKSEIDQIRGVESGHLMRALMEKNLVKFAGKSELPGKPMLYGTTKDFLELFGLRNIRELPTLTEIDELIPDGIGEVSEIQESETLGTLTEKLGLPEGKSYSDSENELLAISTDLAGISTSSEFFEQEKRREKERRENERAQDLRERKIVGETLSDVDSKWLARFEMRLEQIVANTLNNEPLAAPLAEPGEQPSQEAPALESLPTDN